jgi:Ca2+-binding EF-hand superfamily protein
MEKIVKIRVKTEITKGVMGEQTNAERDAKSKMNVAESYTDLAETIFAMLDTNSDELLSKDEIGRIGSVSEIDLSADEITSARNELSSGEEASVDHLAEWLSSDSSAASKIR